MQLTAALDHYLVQLEANGRSPHTCAQARRHVKMLVAWLAERGTTPLVGELAPEDVAAFLASPAVQRRADGKPRRASSANAVRSSLRAFTAFAAAAGYAPRDAGRLVQRARCGTPPPRAASPADTERLLAALATAKTAAGRRDHALFGLLLGAGLRIGSAVGIRVEDLDLDEGAVTLRSFKGGRTERAYLPAGTVAALRGYLRGRKTGALFPGRHGGELSTRQAARRLRIGLAAAGIERRFSPHALRHAFAVGLLRRTGNLRLVQRALGHQSVSATAIYATIDDDEVRRAVRG